MLSQAGPASMRGGDENAGTGPQRNRDGNQRFNVSQRVSLYEFNECEQLT